LTVPARRVEAFQRLVHQKLEARFTTTTHAQRNPKPHEE
jgi:hypothetical protein